MQTYTHYRKFDNPDYIGAYAFQPGEKKTLTIAKVTREIVTGSEGIKEECTIVHWREAEKPLILKATNGKMITKVTGSPYIEEWIGKRVVLGTEKVKAFGEVVDAVRVKKDRPAQSAAQPVQASVCVDCGATITDAGGYTAQSIIAAGRKRYGQIVCLDCANTRGQAPKEAVNPEGAV